MFRLKIPRLPEVPSKAVVISDGLWDAILTIETAIDASGILPVRAWQLEGSLLDLVTTLQELASPK